MGHSRPSIPSPALSRRDEDKSASQETDGFRLCPVDGCNVRAINIEPHIRGEHLVEIFQELSGGLRSNLLVRARFEALQTQSKMILGKVDIWGLVAWVNRQVKNWPRTVEEVEMGPMREVCAAGGWTLPSQFTLVPVNSPGVLIHWRIQILIMSWIGERRSQELREMYPVGSILSQGRIGPPLNHSQASASMETSPRLENAVSRPRPITVDAHFHLDRAWAKTNLPGRPNLRQYMEMRLPSSQLYAIDVRGRVINFCDPRTWPSDKELEVQDQSWVVDMGVHPKKARELDDARAFRLETLLKTGKLRVLGEVGLDFSTGAPQPQIQISTLRWVLAMASQGGVPVVLHVRGGKDDVHSAQAHIQCIRQCRAILNKGHPIHLHCFDGGWEQAQQWMDNFPGVHFGFTGAVNAFSEDQKLAVVRIPRDRLLRESDAPYFRPAWVPRAGYGHPKYLAEVARGIAAIRQGATVDGALQEGGMNALRFYGLRV
ncbi:tatD [Mytilus edulis]|uniref:TatD n=1 Tax=Mytilus edulis TaxID=6550 RepID=A0A8S3UEU9_MYTED|nr:tatD [Mytilus edulis]